MSQRRKLAAILSADVVGYSRLMGNDERATVETLQAYRQLIRERVERHGGRVVDSPGDALLAEFSSAVEAMDCAQEVQHELAKRNAQLAEHRRMQFRIGINLGDVIEENSALYGDGVNIAARLEALADAGGVCVSGTVFDQVEGKLPLRFQFMGEQQVKNIPKPVRVYRLAGEGRQAAPTAANWMSPPRRRVIVLLTAIVVLAAATAGGWYAIRSRPIVDPVLALPTGPSIAVLPFANLSGDPTQDYFADGITEQIITELTRFRNLFVIARNSTFQYKGKAVDVRQVGKELNARYVVEGSVQRGGDIVRVTVLLLDARTGAHLWAETYERDFKQGKVFGVQDDITERVVGAIADAYGAISRATFEESKGKGTNSLDAYECVLRYYAYENILTPEVHLRARECLERAVKLAPSYAEAWANLADNYDQEYFNGFNPRPDPLGRALQAAQRAVELDAASPRAHSVLSGIYFFRHDLEAFASHGERAVALNPNNAEALAWFGDLWIYSHMTDPAQRARGLAMIKKAMTLSPMYPGWYHFPIAWHYWVGGEYDIALAEAKKIDIPGYYYTHVLLATVYGAMDRKEEGRAEAAKSLELYPDFPLKTRSEFRKWNFPDSVIDRVTHDLRRAGMEIPAGT